MSGAATTLIVVVVILAIVVIILVYMILQRRNRSAELQTKFGPEYDRTLDERGGRKVAEQDLMDRQERHDQLRLRDLDGMRREQLSAQWEQVQSRFVDQPVSAVLEAYQLVRQVMAERGYPTEDFESQADAVSVDHPEVVENYREAVRRTKAAQAAQATTEELREAMVSYRSLFGRLLDAHGEQVHLDRS
jgi:FtsZ-interacting cell division protein ZipA